MYSYLNRYNDGQVFVEIVLNSSQILNKIQITSHLCEIYEKLHKNTDQY